MSCVLRERSREHELQTTLPQEILTVLDQQLVLSRIGVSLLWHELSYMRFLYDLVKMTIPSLSSCKFVRLSGILLGHFLGEQYNIHLASHKLEMLRTSFLFW